MEQTKEYTLKELREFNGKNGKVAYIAYKGKVYDLTNSELWRDGDHLGHAAGQDLTEEMEIAPHGEEVIERMRIVGVLAKT